MITAKGASLKFPLEQVNEFKKTSRGLKGITFTNDSDKLVHADIAAPDNDDLIFDGRHYNPKNIRSKKRNDKPTKSKIFI